MAQNPFDQLAKQYLEEFLAPIGTVQRQVIAQPNSQSNDCELRARAMASKAEIP
jgi:hypothetical protein